MSKREKAARRRDGEGDRKLARELAEAKAENSTLKRAIARLQKPVQRLENERSPDEDEVEQKPQQKKAQKVEAPGCSKCASTNLTEFTSPGGKRLTVCKDCKARVFS